MYKSALEEAPVTDETETALAEIDSTTALSVLDKSGDWCTFGPATPEATVDEEWTETGVAEATAAVETDAGSSNDSMYTCEEKRLLADVVAVVLLAITHRRRRLRVGAGFTSTTSVLMSSVIRSISIWRRASSLSFRSMSFSSFRRSWYSWIDLERDMKSWVMINSLIVTFVFLFDWRNKVGLSSKIFLGRLID